MKRPSIPPYTGSDFALTTTLDAIRQNIEQLGGVRGTPIVALSSSATLAEVITKVNEIVRRLSST